MDNVWQTRVDIEKPDFVLDYHSRLLLIGSCFAENMGNKLGEKRFAVDVNPSGIVYNPESVAQVLQLLIEGRPLTGEELVWNKGKWVSFFHHGSFSSVNREECLKKINKRLQWGADWLRKTDLLMITFGTSWVYRYIADGRIVANCHRFEAGDFERFRLSVSEITSLYDRLLGNLRKLNPAMRVLFTVSPIRHWKDGAHENQLSKSVLLLAIDDLLKHGDRVYYFPSYEIVQDELRDYRFYAEDMLHISDVAVDYIWTRFRDTFFSAEALGVMKQVEKINKGLKHRPFDRESKEYLTFYHGLRQELNLLKSKYPLMNSCEEVNCTE